MSSRLVIVDRSLTDERGHHYALTNVITQGALAYGAKVTWFTNKSFCAELHTSEVDVRPVFQNSTYDLFKQVSKGNLREPAPRPSLCQAPKWLYSRIRNSIAYRWAVYRDRIPPVPDCVQPAMPADLSVADELEAQLDIEDLDARDHILVHTADGEIYRAILELVLRGKIHDASPCIHLVTPYDIELMPHYSRGLPVNRVIGYLKLFGFLNRRVFIYGEHEVLSDYLSQAWEVPVLTLSIPPPCESSAPPVRETETLTVAYLGAAREEKGFLLLPDIIEKCRKHFRAAGEIKFIIQCNPQIVGYTASIRSCIEQLREYVPEWVELIETEQSMGDYYDVLRKSDVVLACYDFQKYRLRGSGIAVEAIAFGDILITTPGTAPAVIAGDAALCASTVDEIADAIVRISENRPLHKANATRRRQEYSRENTGPKYVAKIFAVGENPGPPKRDACPAAHQGREKVCPANSAYWKDELQKFTDGDGGGRYSFPMPQLVATEAKPVNPESPQFRVPGAGMTRKINIAIRKDRTESQR